MDVLVKNSGLLEHQVAGSHTKCQQDTYSLLNCNDGTLLKPIQPPPKGPRELNFYKMLVDVTEESNRDLWQLRRFIPHYYGFVKSNTSKETSVDEFIRMENVLTGMHKPCIMDIKVGRITYDPEATKEKMKSEMSKYPPQERVGFIILGMKVYNQEDGQSVFFGHMHWRSLHEDDILMKGLGKFYGWPDRPRPDLVTSALSQLNEILAWFTRQRQLAFYASSILFAYEGDSSSNNGDVLGRETLHATHDNNDTQTTEMSTKNDHNGAETTECNRNSKDNLDKQLNAGSPMANSDGFQCGDITNQKDHGKQTVIVKMIDFTHVFPTTTSDDNYIYGLKKLIGYLEQLLLTV